MFRVHRIQNTLVTDFFKTDFVVVVVVVVVVFSCKNGICFDKKSVNIKKQSVSNKFFPVKRGALL